MENSTAAINRFYQIKAQIQELEDMLEEIKPFAIKQVTDAGGKFATDKFKATIITKATYGASQETMKLQTELFNLEQTIAEQKKQLQAKIKQAEASDKTKPELLISKAETLRIDTIK